MNGVDLCQHEAVSGEREFNEYLSQVTESADVQRGTPSPLAVATGGCDPLIDDCATLIGGDDPSIAYAAAMLWYQGYPNPPPGGG